MSQVLEGERVGVALNSFNEAAFVNGLQALLKLVDDPATRARCVQAAQKHFSLEEGVRRYVSVYEKLDDTE